jgi:3-phytase
METLMTNRPVPFAMKTPLLCWAATLGLLVAGCERVAPDQAIAPRVVTTAAPHDTDDPAIWINRGNPAQSLVVGTDKDTDGALMAFDLQGKVVGSVPGLQRPNNVDVAYGLMLGGRPVDIAVLTEREAQRLRVFRLPDLAPLDTGDLSVFDGDTTRGPMGIALYTRPSDGAIYAIVGGKTGPDGSYLWQYRLEDNGAGQVQLTKVREFGAYSGRKEIEAIAVDNELGYVYYSDEQFGVHKYHADPAAPAANEELALFGTTGFAGDMEGISIYKTGPGTGYILVSNQQADTFRVFPREGTALNPHEHPLVKSVRLSTRESDGSDVTNVELPGFPGGLFVAMSTDRTFHYYAWADLARVIAPAGSAAAK